MNLLHFYAKPKYRLIYFLVLIIVSLVSMYTPHCFAELQECHNYDNLLQSNRVLVNSRFLVIVQEFLSKILMLSRKLWYLSVYETFRLVYFDIGFSKKFILQMFYLTCFYFNGGKFKDILMNRLEINQLIKAI